MQTKRNVNLALCALLSLLVSLTFFVCITAIDRFVSKAYQIENGVVHANIMTKRIARRIRAGIVFEIPAASAFYISSVSVFNDKDNYMIAGMYDKYNDTVVIMPTIAESTIETYRKSIITENVSQMRRQSYSTVRTSVDINDRYRLYTLSNVTNTEHAYYYIEIFSITTCLFVVAFIILAQITSAYNRYLSIILKAFENPKPVLRKYHDPYCRVVAEIKAIDAQLDNDIAATKKRLDAISNDEGY